MSNSAYEGKLDSMKLNLRVSLLYVAFTKNMLEELVDGGEGNEEV